MGADQQPGVLVQSLIDVGRMSLKLLNLLKPVIMLMGGATAVFVSQQDLRTEWFEKAPTPYTAGELLDDYRGERWLSVTGKLRFDAMSINYGRVSKVETQPKLRVRVAMVDADAPRDAVATVVWSFDPFQSEQEIAAWRERMEAQPVHTLTGLRQPVDFTGVRADLFPALNVENAMAFNEGNTPKAGPAMWVILGIGVVMIVVGIRKILRITGQLA